MADAASIKANVHSAFRDHVVEGVPASGDYEPDKALIRSTLGDQLVDYVDQVGAAAAAGRRVFGTLAERDAWVDRPVGAVAYVTATDAYYRWSGSAWEAYSDPAIDAAEQAQTDAERAEAARDETVVALAEVRVPYLTNVVGLKVVTIGQDGWSVDYAVQGKGSSLSGSRAPLLSQDWIEGDVSGDGVMLRGVHRDGYGVLEPLPAIDWLPFADGEIGSREIWIAAEGREARRVSLPSEGDCHSPSLLSNRLRYVIGVGEAAVARSMILTGGALSIIGDKVLHFAFSGQSNCVGNSTFALVNGTPPAPGRALMFTGGPRLFADTRDNVYRDKVLTPDLVANIIDAREVIYGNAGESPATGFAKTLAAAVPEAVLISNHAVGAASLPEIDQGSIPWTNMLETVRRGRFICAINDLDYDVPALIWNWGEAISSSTIAVSKASLEQVQADFETDIDAILGEEKTRPLIFLQVGNTSHYNVAPNVSQGQLEAALANPGKIICAGPGYIYPTVADGVHKTAQAQADSGAAAARYAQRFLAGQDTMPLHVVSAVRTGSAIILTFHLPQGAASVSRNTSLVSDPGNWGLSFHQTGGGGETITNVAVTASDKITITLSAAPAGSDQKVGVAWLFNDGAAAPGGPTTGSRSQIATNTGEYACTQLIPVT